MSSEKKPIRLFTSKEAAFLFRVSEQWIKRNRKLTNRISYIQIGRRIYYEETDLLHYVKKQKTNDKQALV